LITESVPRMVMRSGVGKKKSTGRKRFHIAPLGRRHLPPTNSRGSAERPLSQIRKRLEGPGEAAKILQKKKKEKKDDERFQRRQDKIGGKR